MKVIAFANNNSGPSFHRIIAPLLLMEGVKVYVTNSLKVEDFDNGCDVFMYNRILPEEVAGEIAELKKKHGFATVVDIDDYWHLDDTHILYEYYQEIDFARQQIEHLKNADAVLCTHSRLAEEIQPYNTNVHVCPNAIKRQGQFDVKRTPSKLVRLFWQGSDTHYDDIELLEAPINGLKSIAAKMKFIMAGYTADHPVWQAMANMYTANFNQQYKLIPPAKVYEYYQAYENADIALAPLVNTKFNRMKSNLKVLEAANMEIPVIASMVHPYLDMPILYCQNSRDWMKHISNLVRSSERRYDAGKLLAEYCQKHFDFDKINLHRKQVLEYVAQKAKV